MKKNVAMTIGKYNTETAAVRAKYDERAQAILGKICVAARQEGWLADAPELAGDEEWYWWTIVCPHRGKPDNPHPQKRWGPEDIDVRIWLVESMCRDGSLDGISFKLDVVAEGGQVVSELAPFNFTEDLWVPVTDVDAVEARFQLIEDTSADEVIDSIRSFLKRKNP